VLLVWLFRRCPLMPSEDDGELSFDRHLLPHLPRKFFEEMTVGARTQIGQTFAHYHSSFRRNERSARWIGFRRLPQISSLPNYPQLRKSPRRRGWVSAPPHRPLTPWPNCARGIRTVCGVVAGCRSTTVEVRSPRRRWPSRTGVRAGSQVVHSLAAGRSTSLRSLRCSPPLRAFDLPIWLHPARTAAMTTTPGREAKPAMRCGGASGGPTTPRARSLLVSRRPVRSAPGIKIITHHCGGMIPYFDGRVGPASMSSRPPLMRGLFQGAGVTGSERPSPRIFQGIRRATRDVGGKYGIRAAEISVGADTSSFATDRAARPLAPTISVIDDLDIDRSAGGKIYSGMPSVVKRKPSRLLRPSGMSANFGRPSSKDQSAARKIVVITRCVRK